MAKPSTDEAEAKLSPEQYEVLINKGTEAPFSGQYLDHHEDGVYACALCGAELFSSQAKYDSKTPGLVGWPSFSEVADSGAVNFLDDSSLGMSRTEVVCSRCGGHLGHVFDAGDSNTGKHYCINSCALNFSKQEEK